MPYTVPIQKFDLLILLLKKVKFDNLIIFFRLEEVPVNQSLVNRHGNNVRVLHSDLKQKDRMQALEEFKKGDVNNSLLLM